MNDAARYTEVEGLTVHRDGGTLQLILRRPEKRNAIDDVMMAGLIGAFDAASTDEQLRVIFLEGIGEHFCGGADIVARNRADGDAPKPRAGSIQRRLPVQAHDLIRLVLEVQVPVVCKVRGYAAGIGFSLALAADFTIAEDVARFWAPFTQRGFTPDSAMTWLLPRRVGEVRARELLMLGRELSGTEAAAWGAIHAVVPREDLDMTVYDFVKEISNGPTVAVGLTKWLLHAGRDASLEQQLRNEGFALELSSRTSDFREGMSALQERRAPRFEGR
jgi:2-(1,2-epoxy-1,2-dihydrophenyl)acetyl-CoA isomerase